MSDTEPSAAAEGLGQPAPALRKRPAFQEHREGSKRARRVDLQAHAPVEQLEAGAQPGNLAAAGAAASAPDVQQQAHAQLARQHAESQQRAEAAALRSQLVEAHALFQEQRDAGGRQLVLELDVAARLAAAAVVGRQLRIYWPDDDAWYLGTVQDYFRKTGEHQVGGRGLRGRTGGRVALPRSLRAPFVSIFF